MRLSDVTKASEALTRLLDGEIKVQTSATKSRDAKVYAMNQMPTTGLGDEFLVIQANGKPDAKTTRRELWNGDLAVAIYCKSNSDGTIKPNRNDSIIAQVEDIIGNGIRSGDFFFCLDENNPITPPTPNLTTGYYTTILNVWWRN